MHSCLRVHGKHRLACSACMHTASARTCCALCTPNQHAHGGQLWSKISSVCCACCVHVASLLRSAAFEACVFLVCGNQIVATFSINGPTATCCVQGSPRVSVALNRSRKIDDRVVLRWYLLMNSVGEEWPQDFASIGQPYVPYAGDSDTAFVPFCDEHCRCAAQRRLCGNTEPVTTMLNHYRSYVICVASGRALFRCTFVQGVHGFANVTGIVAPSIICSHIRTFSPAVP